MFFCGVFNHFSIYTTLFEFIFQFVSFCLQLGPVTFKITELVKGVPLNTTAVIGGLVRGAQYTLQVVPNTAAGPGVSSINGQNIGQGVVPLAFTAVGEPSAPAITSAVAISTSQVALTIQPPADNGGAIDFIFPHISEFTTSSFNLFPYLKS